MKARPKQLMSTAEACASLKVSRQGFHKLAKREGIKPAHKDGPRSWWWASWDVRKIAESRLT
jgi:hypothetical protein